MKNIYTCTHSDGTTHQAELINRAEWESTPEHSRTWENGYPYILQDGEKKGVFWRLYIIDRNEPFTGRVQNTITNDKVDYMNGKEMSLEEYKNQPHLAGKTLELVDGEEMGRLVAQHRTGLIGNFEEITEEKYYYYLEVLPPMHYDGTYFQVRECLQYDLYRTCLQHNGKYYAGVLPAGSPETNKKHLQNFRAIAAA